MSRIVPPLTALGVLLAPMPAAAQLAIDWDVPAGECPTVDAVRGEVVRLVGGTLPEDLELEAHAIAEHGAGRWTLRLHTRMDGVDGERVVEGDACAPLADATALILALMIDPDAVAAHVEPPPVADPPITDPPTTDPPITNPPTTDPPTTDPPSEPPTHVATAALSDPVDPDPSPRPRGDGGPITRVVEHDREPGETPEGPVDEAPDPPLAGFLGLGGAFDLGSVPDPSGALHLEGGFGIPLIEARIRATFVFGQDASRSSSDGARITTGTLDARACVHPFDEARLVYGCLGLALGVSVAEGFGVSGPEVGVGTFAGAVAGLGLAWSPEPWFDLDLDATLIVPFNPLEFAVRATPDDVFHTQEPVAGRFGLSFHVRF
ncbi:MAG: hypothetical protein KC619_01625 [Myxococcales bacterium]|nr:hypothetical protein [Myxococcales bacterium]